MALQESPGASHSMQSFLPPASHQTPLLTLVWHQDEHVKQDARQVVVTMLQHACGPYGHTVRTGGDARLAWGLLLPDLFTSLTCWSVYTNGIESCVIEGDFYDDVPGLKLCPGDNPALAQYVATSMRADPERPFTDLNGVYSGFYVNHERSCVYVFGDCPGNRSIFWLADQRKFVVTGNLWAFRGYEGFERRWDPIALTEMLTIGFPMAGRTWLSEVRQLQRGRQVRAWSDGRTDVRKLLTPVERQTWPFQQSVQFLRDSLDATVKRLAYRLHRPGALALSGGLDSRLLLASLHTQKLDHYSFTFCDAANERDQRIAQAAVQLLGRQHTTIMLESTVADQIAPDLCLLNEGESLGTGYFILAAQAQKVTNNLWLGHEAIRETTGSFQPLALKNRLDLATHMLRSTLSLFTPAQVSEVLARPYRVPWDHVWDEWCMSFEQIDQPSLTDVYMEHIADYRVQRRTRPRLEQVRWYCLPVYPFMDMDYATAYRSLPLAHIHAERAPLALLCSYKTGLEQLPSASYRFGMPIRHEFRYRHLLHCGRVIQARYIKPLTQRWRESKGIWGLSRHTLTPWFEAELPQLKDYELFHWPALQALIARAHSGTFFNHRALRQLITVALIDDFLFSPGFPAKRTLSFLKPWREDRGTTPG